MDFSRVVVQGGLVDGFSLTEVEELSEVEAGVSGVSHGFVGFTDAEVDVLVSEGVSTSSANFCRMVAGVEDVEAVVALKDAPAALILVLADLWR